MTDVSFQISAKDHKSLNLKLKAQTKLADLGPIISKQWGIPEADLDRVKLLHRSKMLTLKDAGTLADNKIFNGAKLKILYSTKAAVDAVKKAKEPAGMASFEHEEKRERARQTPPASPASVATLFQSFEAWEVSSLTPPPSEAMKLLRQLAADPGILGVMKKYNWKVGKLSEMPPSGKVGVSPVCILGVNVNKGQEISLRLRTDDLKGFRRYDRIRETLIHELAHMVHSDHDNSFKELNSQLRRELEQLDWKNAAGARTVGGGPAAAPFAPTLGIGSAGGASVSGGKLGGSKAHSDAKTAAAAAALRRAGHGPSSFPIDVAASPPSASPAAAAEEEEAAAPDTFTQPPKKGDPVLYRQRDGTWVQAKVVAVDVSVQPPSFGIELPSADGPNYRETELPRLKPVPVPKQEESGIDGGYKAHYDPATAEKEQEVQRMFE